MDYDNSMDGIRIPLCTVQIMHKHDPCCGSCLRGMTFPGSNKSHIHLPWLLLSLSTTTAARQYKEL